MFRCTKSLTSYQYAGILLTTGQKNAPAQGAGALSRVAG